MEVGLSGDYRWNKIGLRLSLLKWWVMGIYYVIFFYCMIENVCDEKLKINNEGWFCSHKKKLQGKTTCLGIDAAWCLWSRLASGWHQAWTQTGQVSTLPLTSRGTSGSSSNFLASSRMKQHFCLPCTAVCPNDLRKQWEESSANCGAK